MSLKIRANRENYANINNAPEWTHYVDLFLFINLENRTDRKKEILRQFQQLGIPTQKVVRIIASLSGFTGCTRSHINALSFAMIQGCKRTMICEDDFEVTNLENFHEQMNDAINNNFVQNVLMISMSPIRISPVSHTSEKTQLVQVQQALAMGAYIVKEGYFEKLIQIFQDALKLQKPHDLVTQLHQKNDKWYGFYPPIAHQRPGYSDIEKKDVNYAYLENGQMMQPEKQ